MRSHCILFLVMLLNLLPLRADEGMWLLPYLSDSHVERMKEAGLILPMESLYDTTLPSLKDAIGLLDYGKCTAGVISSRGLIMTNHHCAENEIQSHSTLENNILQEGFFARNQEEEIPNPGLTVSFVVKIVDVTERVLTLVNHEMTEDERNTEIEREAVNIIEKAERGNGLDAYVLPFFGGNEYYLMVLQTYRDVRLVAVPPASIGNFGGQTDNWEWPRHNADFTLMRVYTDPEGKPAEYSPDNIPYQPEVHLQVSGEGIEEGDFVMVMGFPGRTQRYLTADRVQEIAEIENRNRIDIRGKALDIMKEDMERDNQIRIQYAAKYADISNYYKYSRGQNLAFRKLGVAEDRKRQEEAFLQWIKEDSTRNLEYGDVLPEISSVIQERAAMEHALSYLDEIFIVQKVVEIFDFAASALPWFYKEMGFMNGRVDEEEILGEMREAGKKFFKDFNAGTDRRIAASMISLYSEEVDPLYYPGFFSDIHGTFKGDIHQYLEHLYRKSIFADQKKFNRYLDRPSVRKLLKDPAARAAFAIVNTQYQLLIELEPLDHRYDAAHRKYIEGLRAMYPDSIFYPDANTTLRLSYGTVGGYRARDAVHYRYYTTLKGVMEKEDPDHPNFTVPQKLKEIYLQKDYGRYAQKENMPVCFLTNLDTSGGNSGSPVINGRGEVVGLNFDGNWEALSGDIRFEDDLQCSLCVDMRYILMLLDKYAGVDYLIKEMQLND